MTTFVRRVTWDSAPLQCRLSGLDIELTERCDNNCIHCSINLPAGDRGASAREMSTDHVKDILCQAADLGTLEVRFTGGEPLLRPDFEELYIFARRLGLKVLVFTNARHVTTRLADLWKRMPPLLPIEVTVYGMHRESYEAVSRARGSFFQFWRGIDLLLDRQIPFVVKGALLPPNRSEMEEFEAWAATIPTMRHPPKYSMFFDLRARHDDSAKDRLIESLRVSIEEGVAVLTRNEARYREASAEFAASFMSPRSDRLFNCGVGQRPCIDAYGYVQPCMGLRAPELTVNSHTLSVAEAFEQFTSLRDIQATNSEYLKRCARCSLRGFCEQCPAKSWAEHGTLDTPVEYLCELAHAQARYLGWLKDKEYAWEQ